MPRFGFTDIPDACRERLRNILETACSDNGIPLIVAHVVDHVNRPLFSHAAGSIPLRDASGKVVHRKAKVDDVFALLGATQLVTAIAALQLVAKGYLDLDDSSIIQKHLPELTAKEFSLGLENQHALVEPPLLPRFVPNSSVLQDSRSPYVTSSRIPPACLPVLLMAGSMAMWG